jgi:AbiV family abortive infection protein
MSPLAVAEVRAAAVAALENARDLVSDAELLFGQRRYPTSFSMAILAAEELGKTAVLVGALDLLVIESPIDWDRLDRRLHSHRAKLRIVSAIDHFIARQKGDRPTDAKALRLSETPKYIDMGKQFGFYVQVEAAKLRIPKQTISREMAADALQGVRGTVGLFDGIEPYIRGEQFARSREKSEFRWLRLLDQILRDDS